MTAETIAKALDGREAGGSWMAQCPGYAPLVGWLVLPADGWRQLDPVVEPMRARAVLRAAGVVL